MTVKNYADSRRDKLLAQAKRNGEEFQRTLVRYGTERFLFRLSEYAGRDRFVLKGAMLFMTWPKNIQRPTGDLDLLAYGSPDPDDLRAAIKDICAIVAPDDGLVFDLERIMITVVREDASYPGVTIALLAYLGKAEIPLQIDIGFGDAVYPPPEKIAFPCILTDMAKPIVLAYPPETVIAEKFEAMVRLGAANTRLKDFYDIWAIIQTFPFEMPTLVQALIGTFACRGIELPSEPPLALTEEFFALPEKVQGWEAFIKRTQPVPIPPATFDMLVQDLHSFFQIVLLAALRPDTAQGHWQATEGWKR